MGSAVLGIIALVGILIVASSPTLQLQIAGFFARKQGEAIQRQALGGKLASEVVEEAGAGAISFGEQLQKNLFGGLLIK